MSKVVLYRLTWNRLTAWVVILISLVISFFIYESIKPEKIESLFTFLVALPFGAGVFTIHLLNASTSLIELDSLSVAERQRMYRTITNKKRIYLTIGIVNFIVGTCTILLFLFSPIYEYAAFSWVTGTFLGIITGFICFIEEMYLSDIKQLLSDRKIRREQRDQLFEDLLESNDKPAHASRL